MSDVDKLILELREAMLAEYRSVTDAAERTERARRWTKALDELVSLGADLRGAGVIDLRRAGWSYGRLATEFGTSRSAAQQLEIRANQRDVGRLSPETAQ